MVEMRVDRMAVKMAVDLAVKTVVGLAVKTVVMKEPVMDARENLTVEMKAELMVE